MNTVNTVNTVDSIAAINLNDFAWDMGLEEHRFEPKFDRHANIAPMKKREAAKKYNSGCRRNRMEPVIIWRNQALEKQRDALDMMDQLEALIID